jgi:homoserine O-acetyltransferase
MSNRFKVFQYNGPFKLESGVNIPGFHLAYSTHGTINKDGSNVVWIFHGITANSDPAEWWPGMVGEGKLFDPAKYFIVCVNMPGSCYGSIGPLSDHPETGRPWYHHFPFFTPRDIAHAYRHLQEELGITRIHIGIGASMGGQILLECAVEDPDLFEHIVPIATNAVHSAWGRAFNASQRMCIETDVTWLLEDPAAGAKGMEVARSIALISYRHYHTYAATQQDDNETIEHFKAESYQRYQGVKLSRRFNAFSYYALSKTMDAHNLARGRVSLDAALGAIRARALVIAVDSDLLFPPVEQRFLAEHIPHARFESIHSLYGHDGFLLEDEKLGELITAFVTPLQQTLEISL